VRHVLPHEVVRRGLSYATGWGWGAHGWAHAESRRGIIHKVSTHNMMSCLWHVCLTTNGEGGAHRPAEGGGEGFRAGASASMRARRHAVKSEGVGEAPAPACSPAPRPQPHGVCTGESLRGSEGFAFCHMRWNAAARVHTQELSTPFYFIHFAGQNGGNVILRCIIILYFVVVCLFGTHGAASAAATGRAHMRGLALDWLGDRAATLLHAPVCLCAVPTARQGTWAG
jgi:hypothetical protein